MNKVKIPDNDIPFIFNDLKNGATFTEIANRYGCKAWTLQKRLNIYHPVGGKNFCRIWEIYPEYMNIVWFIFRKYKYIQDLCLYDIIIDYCFELTVNQINIINNIESNNKKFWKIYDFVRAKLWSCYLNRKGKIHNKACLNLQ